MKKRLIIISFSISLIVMFFYLQYGRESIAYNSSKHTSNDSYTENVYLVANKLYIWDKEEYATEIIQKCADNTLKGIKFSYDIKGYPQELHIYVYMNNFSMRSQNVSFEIAYTQDPSITEKGDIKNNPDNFKITIQMN